MTNYSFNLPTDHFQFYVEDSQTTVDTSTIWDDKTEVDRIALAAGFIAVTTVRFGGLTTIELTFHHESPAYSVDDWHHIVHCSIMLESGKIIIHSPELDYVDAPIVIVEPGNYEVLVLFSNLDGFDDEMDMMGDDFYKLAFWKENLIEPFVIKQHTPLY